MPSYEETKVIVEISLLVIIVVLALVYLPLRRKDTKNYREVLYYLRHFGEHDPDSLEGYTITWENAGNLFGGFRVKMGEGSIFGFLTGIYYKRLSDDFHHHARDYGFRIVADKGVYRFTSKKKIAT